MEFDITVFLGSLGIIFLGAILQAATGLGAGLIVVPLLALIDIAFIPGPVIFASLVLSFLMAYQGRAHISTAHINIVLFGLLLGMAAGALLISIVSISQMGLLFGTMILFAVLASGFIHDYEFTLMQKWTAGVVSGFLGTTAAIGAPILALLYQFEEGKVIRATLGLLYFISSIIMLMFLHFAGHFATKDLLLGVYLIPGFVLGYLFSGKIAGFIDRGYARPAVLLISAISALALIVKTAISQTP